MSRWKRTKTISQWLHRISVTWKLLLEDQMFVLRAHPMLNQRRSAGTSLRVLSTELGVLLLNKTQRTNVPLSLTKRHVAISGGFLSQSHVRSLCTNHLPNSHHIAVKRVARPVPLRVRSERYPQTCTRGFCFSPYLSYRCWTRQHMKVTYRNTKLYSSKMKIKTRNQFHRKFSCWSVFDWSVRTKLRCD